ncbi:helix-turn-helix domain-containing protein [Kribbella sancticallisti]|uniref:Helix-turn-helix domain-containing protein n=1 Tax=Kribbella sancticallisti TaxID=460087 RepID=A0ABN2DIX5_9ACTN
MLETIGLGPVDEDIYNALVRRSRATVPELIADTRTAEAVVRRSLGLIVELGLATRIDGRPAQYVAVSPDSGLEAILRQREGALHEVRSHVRTLMEMYRAGARFNHPGELVEVVSGREEVNHRWVEMQQNTRVEMRGFDRPPYAAPQAHSESNPVELDLLKRGVKYRVIYDRTVLELPGWLEDVSRGIRHGEQARIASDLPMKLGISDDRLAIIPLLRTGDDAVTASYLVHPSPLLDALVALFDLAWERSVPVRLGMTAAEGEEGEDAALSDDEVRLLTLLAAGATDKAASRALGWSERTVQRHVMKLSQRVGAQTRFQLAMEATRRDWI